MVDEHRAWPETELNVRRNKFIRDYRISIIIKSIILPTTQPSDIAMQLHDKLKALICIVSF